jgi:hypothetical protein
MRTRTISAVFVAAVLILAQGAAALASPSSAPRQLDAATPTASTHTLVWIERETGTKVGAAAPLPANLATWCATVVGYMWNAGWSSRASQQFCVAANYVYAVPGTTQCSSSWWIKTTWCGIGAGGGWYADGGDNVWVPFPGYSAYLRVWMNAAGAYGVKCWGAYC